MDREAFQFNFNRFTKDRTVTAEGKTFATVKEAFLDYFVKREKPREAIGQASSANLNELDLLQSLRHLGELSNRANFNNEAKFGLLLIVVMRIALLATFATYRGASDYKKLKKAVHDFELGKKAFILSSNEEISSY